jgi:large subunit ribosomal protein L4e
MGDPEEKDAAPAGSAKAKPAPKRRGRAKKPAKAPKATKAPKPKEPKEERPGLAAGEVHVYSLDGDVVKTVELPEVFRSDVRVDLIRRAVTAFQANRRQPYGSSHRAGMRHSVRWSGKGHGVSRVPRLRGTMTGAQAPGTVGGRRAHPPRPDRVWAKKVNEHERRLARNGAIAALKDPAIVASRGHRFDSELSLPVVVEDGLEALEPESGAAREGLKILKHLGLLADVERSKDGRHIRAGRGKMRGRRYRQPRSLLVVVKGPDKVRRLLGNLPGVQVVSPAALNAEILAPGGDPGRLTVFSEGALEVLRSWPP